MAKNNNRQRSARNHQSTFATPQRAVRSVYRPEPQLGFRGLIPIGWASPAPEPILPDARRWSFAPPTIIGGVQPQPPQKARQRPSSVNRNLLAQNRAPWSLEVQAPHRTPFCIRRKARREVLFALNRTGKGARSPRRFTAHSQLGC